MEPNVKGYLSKKYNLIDPEEYDRQMVEAQEVAKLKKDNADWLEIGQGFANAGNDKNRAERTARFQNVREGIQKDTVGALEDRRKAQVQAVDANSSLNKMNADSALRDPNSNDSVSFRKMMERSFPDVAKIYGDAWQNVTAADRENIFQPLKLREEMETRKENARVLAGQRSDAKQAKIEENNFKLATPYGLANTEDDAKKLKEAHESKKNFDQKLSEMIGLRKKHKGGAILNRDDVDRGKALSKDLLLEYKNLAKLGVLSQADEAIINAIIPADPLEYNSPLAAVQGQDPILHRMENFKKDKEQDFQTRVGTRTRDGIARSMSGGSSEFPKQVRKDGHVTTVENEQELKEAMADGWQ